MLQLLTTLKIQVMRKYLFCLLLAIATCIITGCSDNYAEEPNQPKAMTHEVTQSEALQHLNKILPDLKIPSTRGAAERSLPPITSSYSVGSHSSTRSNGEVEPYFHIFNFGNNEGFAIMSGDDRVAPLLALTFKGELTPDTEIDNPGFKIAYEMMEDYYVEQVSTFSLGGGNGSLPIDPGDNPELERYSIVGDPVTIYHDMPTGFCQVKWGQEYGYNSLCPQISGELPPAGCTAVAVAQLMSMYEYPSSYNGFMFDWDDMKQYRGIPIGIPITDLSNIARLMQQLGLSQNLAMQYGLNGSGTTADRVPITFENFGYSNGGDDNSYNTDDVVDELLAGYPVLIGGSDGYMPHMWLGHGVMEYHRKTYLYNGYDQLVSIFNLDLFYILCNWGKYGYDDGYYLSNVFSKNEGPRYPEPVSTRSDVAEGNYQYNIITITNIRK